MSSPHLTLPVSTRDHIKGSPEAAITLVEYGDFECPHCGRAYPIVEELCQKMGQRMRFVFRNFPLAESHPHAELAAESAEAAGEQDRFWQMHSMLFTHQDALTHPNILQYAQRLKLDIDRFEHALKTRAFEKRVREDFMSGVRSGVNGTPTFFINGARYDGLPMFEPLLEALESVSE
jgi:protein-disulfide isomerase